MPAEYYARKTLVNHEFITQPIPETYELLYGRRYFQCSPMRCKLSVEACADNHRRGLNLACLSCAAGAKHAQTAADGIYQASDQGSDARGLRQSMGRSCIRCNEQQAGRLMAESYCPACWNRSLEVIAGRNSKGTFPVLAAAKLRRIEAIVVADAEALAEFLRRKFVSSKVLKWELIDSGAALLTGVAAGREELRQMLNRTMPDAEIADFTERAIVPPVRLSQPREA